MGMGGGEWKRAGVCYQSRPSPLLASVVLGGARSFLALLLSASPQEVVRHSPYGARGPAYRIRDPAYRVRHPAYRSRRGCLEDDDLVVLHARYRPAGGLRHPTTYTSRRFVGGPQGVFALPEGQTAQPAVFSIPDGDEPLEPVQPLKLR